MKTQINQITKKITTTCFVLLASLAVSQAANGTWLGTGGSTWANAANWSAAPVPGFADTATFNGTGNGNTTIDLGGGVTVSNIIFDTATVVPYTIGAGVAGSQTLTLSDGGAVELTGTVTANQLFDANLVLGTGVATNYLITNGSTATLTFAAGTLIQGGAGGTAGAKFLTNSGNITIAGNLTNGGATSLSLQQEGTGTLTLTGTNTFTGPIGITGTLTLGGAGLLGTNIYAGNITDNGLYNFNSSLSQTNTGTISGTGGLTVNGPGALVLTSSETFSGATTVNGGVLVLQNGGSPGCLANSAITVGSSGVLVLNAGDALGYGNNNPITISGIVMKTNNQSETLFRPITMSGGTLTASTNGGENFNFFGGYIQTVTGTASIISGTGQFGLRTTGTFFSNAANSTLTIQLPVRQYSGGVPLVQIGPGNLILTATNTFTAGITISNGTVTVAPTGRLNSGANYAGNIINYGTFTFSALNDQGFTGNVTNTGTINFNGTGNVFDSGFITNMGTMVFSSPGNQTFFETISGTGALTQNGPGILTLNGANTYTGLTTINGGIVAVYSSQPNTGTVTVNDGGTLRVTPTPGGATGFSPATLNVGSGSGATIQVSLSSTTQAPLTPGALNLTGANTVVISAASPVTAGQTYPVLSYTTLPGTGTLSFTLPADIVGTVNLVGQTYQLTVTSVTAAPISTWTSAVNGTWDINTTANWSSGDYQDHNQVVFDDSDNTGGIFAITNLVGAAPVSPRSVTFNNSINNYTISNTVTIAGITGVTLNGTGFVTNRSINTYTGPTVINNGTLVAAATWSGAGGALGVNSAVSLQNSATAALALNNSTWIGSLTGGGATGGNVNVGGSTLTLGSDNSTQTYGGVISGTGGLAMIGSASLTLTNTNTYTGTTTIGIADTLTIGNEGELGGGTYGGSIVNNKVFNWNSSSPQTNTAGMSGLGVLNVNGSGILTLSGQSSFTGPTFVNNGATLNFRQGGGTGTIRNVLNINQGGTVNAYNGDAIGYNGGASVTILNVNGGTFNDQVNANQSYITSWTLTGGTVASPGGGAINFNTGYGITNFASSTLSTWSAPIVIRGTGLPFTVAQGTVPGGVDLNVSGVISGGGGNLSLTGPGTLELSGVNTTGVGLLINSGTLLIGGAGSLGSGNYGSGIANNGTFAFGSTALQTLTGRISGTGTLLVNAPANTLTISNAESYTGPTIVGAGTLLLPGTASIASTPSIVLSNGAIFDVSQQISTFTLGGLQTLTGDGTVSGPVTTSAGAVVDPGVSSNDFATLTFNNNLTLVGGSVVRFDFGPSPSPQFDKLAVTGTLSASGNTVHVRAPDPTKDLDPASAPYTLITAGTLTGTFSAGVAWDAPPHNLNHFIIGTSGNTVQLQYSSVAVPVLTATAVPSTLLRNQSALISVTLTQGAGTVTNLTLDASPIGGTNALTLVEVGATAVYTNTVTVAPATLAGIYTLTATAIDTTPTAGTALISLSVIVSTETWAGGGADENFDTALNWFSTYAPGYVGDSAVFGVPITGGTAGPNPSLNTNYTFAGMTFTNGATNFTISSTTGNTLGLSSGLTNNSTNAQVLNVPVNLTAPVTFNTHSGNLTLGGGVSDANGGFVVVGSNTLTLSGTSTFTGGVRVRQGTMNVAGTVAPTNNFVISDGFTSNGIVNILSTGTLSQMATNNGQYNGDVVLATSTNVAAVLTMVTGGNLLVGEQLNVGNGAGGYANFNMSGGTANIGSFIVVGFNGDHAEFDMSGGTAIVQTNCMTIGAGGTNSTAVANFSGGTFTSTDSTYGDPGREGGVYVGENGNGTLNVSGTAVLDIYGGTNLTLGVNAGAVGVVNLRGGTINTAQVAGGAGTSTFNFNGGTLMGNNSATFTAAPDFMYNLGAIYVYGGGAIIDDGGNGNTMTIAEPLQAPTGSGVASIPVATGGAGYIAPPIVTISGGSGSGAKATATVSGGAVTQINVVNPGTGYAANDALSVSFYGGGPTIVSNNPVNGTIATAGTVVLAPNVSGGLTKISSGSGGGTLTLSAPATYTNVTTINGGTLALGAGGSISNSPVINVASGAFFDVSAASFTLLGSQVLEGLGQVNGAFTTGPGSQIIPGEGATFGTLTTSGLDLGSGSTAVFGLTSSGGGLNDTIQVYGNLALNGNTMHIVAPGGISLDTTTPYVLFNVSSTISGFAATAPHFDVAPANLASGNWSIQTSSSQVVLENTATPPPTGTGSAVPNNVIRNHPFTINVTILSANGGASSVVVDMTFLGGGLVPLSPLGGNNWSTNTVLPPGAPPGPLTLTGLITDGHGLGGTVLIPFNVEVTTETWNGNDTPANANWQDGADWASTYAPGYVGDSLIFAGTKGLAPNMDQSYTVNGLGFDSTAGLFVIGGSGFSLGVTGGVTNNSANVETLNVPVTLPVGAAPVFTAAVGELDLDQGVGGSGNLVTAGPGNVVLLGNNSYAGSTTINSGTLILGGINGALNSGPFSGQDTYASPITNNGVFEFNSGVNQTNSGIMSGTGSVVVNGMTGSSLDLTAYNTYAGPTTVNSGGILNLYPGGGAGTIINTLIVNQGGYVNTFSRDAIGYNGGASVTNLTINGGIFNLGFDNLGYIANVYMTGGSISNIGSTVNGGNGAYFNWSTGFGIFTYPSATTAIIDAGVDIRGTSFTISNSVGTAPGGVDLNITGYVNNSQNGGGVGPLTKQGPGITALSHTNSYPGVTTIAGGELRVNAVENPGVSGPLGTPGTPAGSIVFSGGTLQYSAVNIFDYSSRFSTAGGQPISIDTAGQNVTFSNVLAGAGSSLTKLGAGTLTLTATNTLSGGVTVSNGTVALGANGSVSNVSGIAISPGAFFDVSLRSSWNLGPTSSLTGSGTASAATLNGNGVLTLGSTSPIILNYDGTHPALTVTGGTLSLHGNAFTVNSAAPLPNSGTPYVVATSSSAITSVGPYTVTGTAIGPTSQATITVSGTQVLLTVTSINLNPPTFGFALNGNVLSLSWPTNSGWILQSNSLNVALPGDWFDVSGSSNVTSINFNLNTAKTNVYFRLRLP